MVVACGVDPAGLRWIAAGLFTGHWWTLSDQVSAAGGGVLFGIASFWIIPEVAESSGWVTAFALTAAAGAGLALHKIPEGMALG